MNTSNKPDMIPISVVDKFVIPIKESIGTTTNAIEKLSENVEELSVDIVDKLSEHDKDCDRRTDNFRQCIFTKDKENMEYFRNRAKEVDAVFNRYTNTLDELTKSNEKYDEIINNFDKVLKDLNDRIKTMITVVVVGFGIFMAVYMVANFMVKGTVNTAVNTAIKQIIESRGLTNRVGTQMYWIDEKGFKRYIYVDNGVKNNEAGQISSR